MLGLMRMTAAETIDLPSRTAGIGPPEADGGRTSAMDPNTTFVNGFRGVPFLQPNRTADLPQRAAAQEPVRCANYRGYRFSPEGNESSTSSTLRRRFMLSSTSRRSCVDS